MSSTLLLNKNSHFYDLFHNNTYIQKKIISKNNFTYKRLLEIIEENVTNSKFEILDYGCGSGSISLYFANKGNKVCGYDISQKAVDIANTSAKYLGLEKLVTFTSKLDVNQKKFDIIICLEVLEHIKNEKKILANMNKLLKKDGTIIMSVPSINSPLYRLNLLNGFDKKVGHIRRYSTDSLRRRMILSNFQVLKIYLEEGFIRNLFFTLFPFNKLVRFIKGPMSSIIAYIDKITLRLAGESDIIMVCKK